MAKVKTRVLIISDTHCAQLSRHAESSATPVAPFMAPLPAADLLIHCGDLTHTGTMEQYHRTLNMLKEINAPVKIVIAGNHDLTLDRDFVLGHVKTRGAQGAWKPPQGEAEAGDIVNQAKDLWLAVEGRAKQEGVQLLHEGIHDLVLRNGARLKVYASSQTPEFCDWAFAYGHNEDRFNTEEEGLSDAINVATNPVPSFSAAEGPIDMLITHGPPYGRLDEVRGGQRAGCPHLLRALMRARPLVHCFGHIHEGWGAERITWGDDVEGIAKSRSSMADWKENAWKRGVAKDRKAIETIEIDMKQAESNHGVFADLSNTGGWGLRVGAETLCLNASIMTVRYQPLNAAWVLDIDLNRYTE